MLNYTIRPRLCRVKLQELALHTDTPPNLSLAAAYRAGVPPLPAVGVREGGSIRLFAGQEAAASAKAAGLCKIPVILLPKGVPGLLFAYFYSLQGMSPFLRAELLTECLKFYEKKALAETLGISANALTQRLRLLQLPPELQTKAAAANLSDGQLTELMKLPNPLRAEGLREIIENDLSPTAIKRMVEEKLGRDTIKARGRRRMVVKDGRIFQNTIHRSVELMQEAGLTAEYQREQIGDMVEYRIRVPQSQLISGSKKA